MCHISFCSISRLLIKIKITSGLLSKLVISQYVYIKIVSFVKYECVSTNSSVVLYVDMYPRCPWFESRKVAQKVSKILVT